MLHMGEVLRGVCWRQLHDVACRRRCPVEDFVVADRGAAANEEPCGNLSCRCTDCRRLLLVGMRSRGEYTKEAEARVRRSTDLLCDCSSSF